MAAQITSISIVYSTVYSGADQRTHHSSASMAFVREIHRGPVTRKMFPFDAVIMQPVCFSDVMYHMVSLLVLHISQLSIYTYISSIYHMYLMWSTKIFDLMMDSKIYNTGDKQALWFELNIKFYHVSTMLKCDKLLSFNESTHTVPVVDPNSLDLLCMNFHVRKDDLFPRNIC